MCFSSEVNEIINEEIGTNSFIQSLLKIVVPVRADMSTVQNRFEGTFSDDSQQNSIPIRLSSLCSMLIDGFNPKDKGFSQPALTVSQLITHEYRKKTNKNSSTIRRRHSRIGETPLSIYVGLKLYATVRSKTLIDRLFHLGICVSYERCLEICNDMSISLLEKYNQNKVFIASTLKLKLFTNLDKSDEYEKYSIEQK